MSAEVIEQQCCKDWNSFGTVPLHSWLLSEWAEDDQRRLNACGNVVMPKVAMMFNRLLHSMGIGVPVCPPVSYVGLACFCRALCSSSVLVIRH